MADQDAALRETFADVSTRDLMAQGPHFPPDVWAEICRRAKPGMMVVTVQYPPTPTTKRREKNG